MRTQVYYEIFLKFFDISFRLRMAVATWSISLLDHFLPLSGINLFILLFHRLDTGAGFFVKLLTARI